MDKIQILRRQIYYIRAVSNFSFTAAGYGRRPLRAERHKFVQALRADRQKVTAALRP